MLLKAAQLIVSKTIIQLCMQICKSSNIKYIQIQHIQIQRNKCAIIKPTADTFSENADTFSRAAGKRFAHDATINDDNNINALMSDKQTPPPTYGWTHESGICVSSLRFSVAYHRRYKCMRTCAHVCHASSWMRVEGLISDIGFGTADNRITHTNTKQRTHIASTSNTLCTDPIIKCKQCCRRTATCRVLDTSIASISLQLR